jgi:hypothetical protein
LIDFLSHLSVVGIQTSSASSGFEEVICIATFLPQNICVTTAMQSLKSGTKTSPSTDVGPDGSIGPLPISSS